MHSYITHYPSAPEFPPVKKIRGNSARIHSALHQTSQNQNGITWCKQKKNENLETPQYTFLITIMPFGIAKQENESPTEVLTETNREIHSTLDALRLTQQEKVLLYALIEPELLSLSPKNHLMDIDNQPTSKQKNQSFPHGGAVHTANVASDLPRPFGMLIEVADIDRAWEEWNRDS